ncbi:MAG: factor-independent urate hydroxylase [Alkalispirochaetaceae bacterium]
MAELRGNSYGKQRVRLTKLARSGDEHSVYEFTVEVMLYGEFEAVYTEGDNASCVPTDTMKNTVYVVAKRNSFSTPEAFAIALVDHFVGTYPQIRGTAVQVEGERWRRIVVDGKPHHHAFVKGQGKRTATVGLGELPAGALTRADGAPVAGGVYKEPLVLSGLSGIEVFKSGGSGFAGYHKDDLTTLPETDDRILATTIDASWSFTAPGDYEETRESVEQAILSVFASNWSPSLQATLFEMGEAILAAVPAIAEVAFAMPNQHHILFDLERFGMENNREIFYGTDSPFGYITGAVRREE